MSIVSTTTRLLLNVVVVSNNVEEEVMGVQFTPALAPVAGYAISCGCPEATKQAPRFGAYQDAKAALLKSGDTIDEALPGCDMPDVCVDYEVRVHGIDTDMAADDDAPLVDIGRDNAPRILAMLGHPLRETDRRVFGLPVYEGTLGAADAQDFLGAVLLALAVEPADEGTLTHEVPNEGGHGLHQWGRHEGYTQDKLAELRALADWCIAHGREVQWG